MKVGASAFVAFVAAASSPAEAGELRPASGERFVIVGRVTKPKSVPHGTPLIPITFDARFVFRVEVERVVSGAAPWSAGSEQMFLLHSPARTFGPYDLEKQPRFRFTFEVDPTPASDRDCRYCLTKLKVEDDQGPKDLTR